MTLFAAYASNHFDPCEPDRHEVIRQIIEAAGSQFVNVKFRKVDGSDRDITFNPKDKREVKGTGTPCKDPNIFKVREVQNKEENSTVWRSFDARRVISISSGGSIVSFE